MKPKLLQAACLLAVGLLIGFAIGWHYGWYGGAKWIINSREQMIKNIQRSHEAAQAYIAAHTNHAPVVPEIATNHPNQ